MPEDYQVQEAEPPRRKQSWFWVVAVSCFVVVMLAAAFLLRQGRTEAVIDSFSACRDAGGQIAESYPERCMIDGRSFTNDAQVVDENETRPVDESSEYVGLAEQEALDRAAAENRAARVVERDGQVLPVTMDLVDGRLNLFVQDGKVYRVEVESAQMTSFE